MGQELSTLAVVVMCIAVIVLCYTLTMRARRRSTTSRKSREPNGFIIANDGGWGDAPETIALNPESDLGLYVKSQLALAQRQAQRNGVAIGERFEYKLVNIPRGTHPTNCYGNMMFVAGQYGLQLQVAHDDRVTFIRTK